MQCIYIKNTIKFSPVKCPDDIECHGVKIYTNAGNITIINLYVQPHGELASYEIAAFKQLLLHQTAILIGDFNAKSKLWHSPTEDARGKQLADLIRDSDCIVINGTQPTRLHHIGAETHINVALTTTNIALKCHWAVCNNSLGSDHAPIEITVNEAIDRTRNKMQRWKLADANWDAFTAYYDLHLTQGKI